MEKLRRAFLGLTIPEPKAIFLPKWDQDTLFRGAWSVVEATDVADVNSDLRAPIVQVGHGAIHFAGEAMHPYISAISKELIYQGKRRPKL